MSGEGLKQRLFTTEDVVIIRYLVGMDDWGYGLWYKQRHY